MAANYSQPISATLTSYDEFVVVKKFTYYLPNKPSIYCKTSKSII